MLIFFEFSIIRKDHVAYLASSEAYIEHDAFTIFDKLMEHMDKWFLRHNDSVILIY